MAFKKIICKQEKQKVLHNRNSLLYTGAVLDIDDDIREGEIVEIRMEDGSLAGYGFYFKGKQIASFIFEFTDKALEINTDFWKKRFENALNFRKHIIPPETNVYRLIHSEGDGIPGLIVDIYDTVAVMEFKILGVENLHREFAEILKDFGIEKVFVKKSFSGQLDKSWLLGSPTDVIKVQEYGLKFFVDVVNGQKTGFFIDQRENRNLIRKFAADKTVLNLFSYTGGFSVYALSGGAQNATSVDISQDAVSLAEKNATENGFNKYQHISVAENAFDFLAKMPANYYDLIVIDPPAFAKTDDAVKNAVKGYKDLNFRAIKKVKNGGIIFTFSCSQKIDNQLFRKIVFGAAADARRRVKIIHQLHQAPDHPVDIFQPKSEYLKGYVLLVED